MCFFFYKALAAAIVSQKYNILQCTQLTFHLAFEQRQIQTEWSRKRNSAFINACSTVIFFFISYINENVNS